MVNGKKNKVSNKKLQLKQQNKKQQTKKENKKKEESKPKKNIQISKKLISAAKYKNKTSKATALLNSASQQGGKKFISSKQIQQGKETHQYKASAKKIKQMRRNGVPKKVIENLLRQEQKNKKKLKKKQNTKFGVK